MMGRLDADVLLRRMRRRFAELEPRGAYAVAVSGGKDSVLLTYLSKAKYYFHLDLGIPDYSEKAKSIVRTLAERLGIEIEIIPISRYGAVLKPGKKTCAVCGVIKRYLFNRIVWEKGIRYLMTGHNLDDFLSFYFQNALAGACVKFFSVSPPAERMVGRVRPLSRFTENEIRAVVEHLRLPYLKEKCPYGKESRQKIIKRFMNALDQRIEFKRPMYAFFKHQCKPREGQYRFCKLCGYPSGGEICKFCKMFNPKARDT